MKFYKNFIAYSCFAVFSGSASDTAWFFPHNVVNFFACLTFLTVYQKRCFFLTTNLATVPGSEGGIFLGKKWKFNVDHPGHGGGSEHNSLHRNHRHKILKLGKPL